MVDKKYKSEDNVKCPHCGYIYPESWEYVWDCINGNGKYTCYIYDLEQRQ